jgi:hypothetical protein
MKNLRPMQRTRAGASLHQTFMGSVERGERNIAILNFRLIANTRNFRIERIVSRGQDPPRVSGTTSKSQNGSSYRRADSRLAIFADLDRGRIRSVPP